MSGLTKKIFDMLSSSRFGRAVLQVVASIGFTFKTKRFSRIFYDGVWVHQHYKGVIVDTNINWSRTTVNNAAFIQDYCLRYYKPKLGDVIIDVGAGIGEETFVFSSGVGKHGKVVSIEPHPKTFLCLSKMCKYNDLRNVITLNVAVTDKESRVFIEDSDIHFDNRLVREGENGIPVRSTTLDQIIKDLEITHIDFIKMNIEGSEKLAIKGMLNTIKKTRNVCISCHDIYAERDGKMEMRTKSEVIEFLLNNNFKIFTRENEKPDWLRDCIYGIKTTEENSKNT